MHSTTKTSRLSVVRFGALALSFSCGTSKVGSDAGDADPCAGLGCAIVLPTLDVTVVDALSNAPVKSPTFAESGSALAATCSNAGDAGVCITWHIAELAIGAHAIAVGATGYAPQTISLTLAGPPACCGLSEQASRTVMLTTP